MSFGTSPVRNIRTIKAVRGELLRIDLGRVLSGTLTAWMKKDPNDTTFRSFTIESNRFLVLSQVKASDFFDVNGKIIERVKGKWYFDVEQVLDLGKPEEVTTVYRGTIVFSDDITNSEGFEVVSPLTGGLQDLKVSAFLATGGQILHTVPEANIVDNAHYSVQVNGQIWNSRTGNIGFPLGNVSIDFATGVITFHFALSLNDQIIIKYN